MHLVAAYDGKPVDATRNDATPQLLSLFGEVVARHVGDVAMDGITVDECVSMITADVTSVLGVYMDCEVVVRRSVSIICPHVLWPCALLPKVFLLCSVMAAMLGDTLSKLLAQHVHLMGLPRGNDA